MIYRKLGLSLSVILVFLAYIAHQKEQQSDIIVSTPVVSTETSAQRESINTPSTTKPIQTRQRLGQYKDGQYTGPVVDAYYGNVQVKVTISGGKLVDVAFLDYPQDRSTSVQINTQAMPYLKQEAITAQSAQVDIIGGATETSGAFQKSLGGALAKAKAS